MHEPSAFDFEMDIMELKGHKSPGRDQILGEMVKSECRTIRSEIHKLIISIWNKEELPEEWKESIIVPIYKIADITNCSNYRSISLFSTTYNFFFFFNILLSSLTPYAAEIIGDHQYGFRRNGSATDYINCIR